MILVLFASGVALAAQGGKGNATANAVANSIGKSAANNPDNNPNNNPNSNPNKNPNNNPDKNPDKNPNDNGNKGACNAPAFLNGGACKINICHATGSSTNPYVLIEVSVNALKGHFRAGHQMGEDIIGVASSASCPGAGSTPKDVCPNIDGAQATVPAGRVLVDGACIVLVTETDVCPNLDGTQTTVPAGTTLVNGACVVVAGELDVCANIDGSQTTVPAGMTVNEGVCAATNTTITPPPPGPVAGVTAPPADTGTTAPAGGGPVAGVTAPPAGMDAETAADAEAVAGAGSPGEIPAIVAGAADGPAGELPYTGLSTWLLVAAGLLSVLGGALLHAGARRPSPARVARKS